MVRLTVLWVKIKFTNIPQSGSFDLMQDPNDGQPATYRIMSKTNILNGYEQRKC
jgi:hypothetical protein